MWLEEWHFKDNYGESGNAWFQIFRLQCVMETDKGGSGVEIVMGKVTDGAEGGT